MRLNAPVIALCLVAAAGAAAASEPHYGFGRPATPAEIAPWDIDVRADGQGLPPGSGSVKQGGEIFAAQCEACHVAGGTKALAPSLDVLVGGRALLDAPNPIKTIGNYWPFATTVFDYIRRAMPFPAPQSLSADEVYALTAWLLYRNGVIAEDTVLDAATLTQIRMPNRGGFIDRDDWRTPKP